MIITGNDPTVITTLKKLLDQQFRIKDLGKLKYFLGIEVARSKKCIYISQFKYTLHVLDDMRLLGVAPATFPLK